MEEVQLWGSTRCQVQVYQLTWLKHLDQETPKTSSCPTRRRPRTRWSDHVTRLTWEELEGGSGEGEVWGSLPPTPMDKQEEMMDHTRCFGFLSLTPVGHVVPEPGEAGPTWTDRSNI